MVYFYKKTAMRQLPICLSLLMMSFEPVFSQKTVSTNFAATPLFFDGKVDLMGEINYELFDSKRKMVRFGIGLGFRNREEQTITDAETTEFSEQYAAIAAIVGVKFYVTKRVNRGLFGGLICQFGFVKEVSEWRYYSAFSGSLRGSNSDKLSSLFKMGPMLGCTLMMNEHWFLEPEIGYMFGSKREIIWPQKEPRSPFSTDHFHFAINIGYRF
jgi:hypothetical protein